MTHQNWRPEVDAADYFGNQRKQLQVADRRPVIRKASDLVGPGIGASATRITDFNDLLATYNGYYSALAGARNAPNSREAFVGHTVMDDTLGGRQVFTGMSSRSEYARTFIRNPGDAEVILWGDWATTDEAMRITNFNSGAASLNGFYSAAAGATNAPNSTESFVGQTITDASLGGRQVFSGLTTRTQYARTFIRDPGNPTSVVWGTWVATTERNIPATLRTLSARSTSVQANTWTTVIPPNVGLSGPAGVYERTEDAVRILQQGTYTGYFRLGSGQSTTMDLEVTLPNGSVSTVQSTNRFYHAAGERPSFPFTFVSFTGDQSVRVRVRPTIGVAAMQLWPLHITRIGDAI